MSGTRRVGTWNDLAGELGVSRHIIQLWRKDPKFEGKIPKQLANGSHDVFLWRTFMLESSLGRAGESDAPQIEEGMIAPPKIAGSKQDWEKAKIFKGYEKMEIEVEQTKGTLILATELEVSLGSLFTALTNKLTQFPERCAAQVAGFTNVQEITSILRSEIEADLKELNAAKFLEQSPAIMAAELKTDPEALAKLDDAGLSEDQRETFISLLSWATDKVCRSIGSKAIERAMA